MRTSPRTDKETAPTPPEGSAPESRERPRRVLTREGLLYCVGVFLAVRLSLFVVGLAAASLLPHHLDLQGVPGPVSVPGWPAQEFTPGWHNVFTVWERFDALWFLRIAVGGYVSGDGSAAFFPLYPLAIRGVSFLIGGHPFAASLIVSNAAFLGALMVLYGLTAWELSEETARKAVLYMAIFPTAFFFFAPYSESLFLLLSVAAFWAARRGRWPIAGVAGALAAATRNLGILLAPALAIEAVHQWVERRRGARGEERGRGEAGRLAWALAWSAVVLVGTFGYLLYWKVKAGDWLAPLHQQAQWERERLLPWVTLSRATGVAFRFLGIYPGGYHLVDWLIVIPVLLATLYAVVRFRPSYGVYAAASVIVPLSYVFRPRPFMSDPRFALVVFPAFWAFAELARRRRIPHALLVGVFAGGLAILSLLFVNWYYIF